MKNREIEMNSTENRDSVTVMSKSGYSPEPKAGAGGNVMSILFSVFMIIGGLSGRFVLRGTNSSSALVVVGILFLIWDIVSANKQKAAREKASAEYSARYSRISRTERAVEDDGRALPGDVSVHVAYDKSLAGLDISPRLNGRSMDRNIKDREFTGGTRHVKNIISFINLDLSAVFEVPEDSGDIVIRLFRDKSGIGIAMPDGAALLPQPEV